MYLFFGRSSSEIAFRDHCIVRHFPNECNATNRNATNQMLAVSAAPTELILCFAVYTQGSVRAFSTLTTLGYAGVSCLKALIETSTTY